MAKFAARSRSASESTIIGSLPPSSSEDGISRAAASAATLRPGAGGAGEHDHVHVLDQGGPGLAVTGGDLQDVLGQTALAQAFGQQQRGQRRHLGGLEDHAVAGGQRGDAVAEGVRQGVVPGADHADQAERAVAQDQLLALHQQLAGLHLLVGEVARRPPWPRSRRRRRRSRSRRAGRPRRSCRSPRRSSPRSGRCCPSPTSGPGAARGRGPRSRTPPTPAGPRVRGRPSRRSPRDRGSGTVATISPVAGFSTGITSAAAGAPFCVSGTCCSTVAI